MARAKLENCPACRRSLPDFGGWPAWCSECGWGLDPDEMRPTVPASRFAAWWQRRTGAAEAAELDRLLADPALLSRAHSRRTTIYAAAIAVHLVTLALLAAGAWVMTTEIVTVLKVFAGVVTFGLVAITFPMHRLRPPTAATKSAFHTTLTVAATVAKAIGVAAPTRVRVTSYGRPVSPTSSRVVTVNVDRWRRLDDVARVALLAHELAHHNGHDPRRTMLVTLASETLDGWLALLRPDPQSASRRVRRTSRRGPAAVPTGSKIAGLSELVLPIVIAPIYGTVLLFGWVLRESGTVAGLRAELYADALAAGTAGTHAVECLTQLIDGELAEWASAGQALTPVNDLPEAERERRRRIAIATGSRIDAMHPTFAARLQMLAAIPTPQSQVYVNGSDIDAMTRELDAMVTPNE